MKNILFLAFLFVPLLHQNLADPNALPENGQIIRLPNGENVMILANDLPFTIPPLGINQFKTAASPSDSTPANCDWNLNDPIFEEVDSTELLSYAKPGARPIPNYYDVSYAADKLGSNMDCDMGHGLDPDGPDFKSEFGTHFTNQAQVNLYMIRRICCYFQLKMNNLLGSLKGTDKFVECENYRHNCDTLVNNDTCYQNGNCK